MKALALVLLAGCIGKDVTLGRVGPLSIIDAADDGAAAACPNAAPRTNDSCSAPYGTYCLYPGPSVECFCIGGSSPNLLWSCSTFTTCPTVQPQGGSTCAGFAIGLSCIYPEPSGNQRTTCNCATDQTWHCILM
jgi:hypothetical protein